MDDTPDSSHDAFTESQASFRPSCQCMQKHTNALCKLKDIETRQNPVKVDTLLTCANLVLVIAEEYFRCSHCADDPRVLMQVVMMFQTIFSWAQAQCHSPDSPCPEISMSFGRYDLPKEEAALVKSALMSRLTERNRSATKALGARVDQMIVRRQGREIWSHERDEIQILQQLIRSLSQSSSMIAKRLVTRSDQSRSK